MSFIAELKRRNVIRMAGLYLVGAWLIVQVSSTVLPMFDAPAWLPRSIVIVLAVGLLPALVFSWVFELTPDGLKRDEEVPIEESIAPRTARRMDRAIITILALALVYFCFDKFVLTPRREATQIAQAVHSARSAPASDASPSAAHSIAVLAFDDLSPAHDQGNFSDGMAEEILNALAHLKSLKVMARSSSFQFKGRDVSPQKIGAELGVTHVLEGSVRKQGEQLRITATLVQTADGVQQWSNSYDGKLADVFDLQESCARDIANQLNAVLGDHGRQRLVDRSTDNADAYALFVQAQTLVNARIGDNLPRAIAMLAKATALDPKFARAWSKLAVAHAVLPQYVGGDWTENLAQSETAAQRALAIDPDNAEAHAALGYVALSRRRYLDMDAPAQRALALDPDDLTANYWAANQLASMGRNREAEVLIDRILSRDPANALVLFYKSMLRWLAGDAPGSQAVARRIDALGSPFGGLALAFLAARSGDVEHGAPQFARALASFGARFSTSELEGIYRGMYQGGPQRATALQVLSTRPAEAWTPTLYLMLGEPERAFDGFEQARTGFSDGFFNFLWLPESWSRKARQSPAFQVFAKRIGLLDYWKKYHWPDLCSPAPDKGPDAFTCR